MKIMLDAGGNFFREIQRDLYLPKHIFSSLYIFIMISSPEQRPVEEYITITH